MKAILGLILVLLLSTALWSQEDQPCTSCKHGTDTGCLDQGSCNSLTGCTTFPFTVCSTGQHTIRAWTTCDGENCQHCASCVSIYDAMPPYSLIGRSCGTDGEAFCQTGGCGHTCENAVPLVADHLYVMYVCLIACPGVVGGCLNCTGDCVAHGCVRDSNGICC